jgi:hypothetical protein
MSDWQEMETAPKDGTRMLGCFWPSGIAIFKRHDCGGRYETWVTDEGFPCKPPRHWMPLPEPPSAALERKPE